MVMDLNTKERDVNPEAVEKFKVFLNSEYKKELY